MATSDQSKSRQDEGLQHVVEGLLHQAPTNNSQPSRHSEEWPGSNPDVNDKNMGHREKWSLGILNDKYTEEVPGTVLLLSSNRNEPLGVHHQTAGHSKSSMPSQDLTSRSTSRRASVATKKKTADGQIILDPQPDDSHNDPLNWSAGRRDVALFSLGFYCMLGGGVTPILAAGFKDVAQTFDVSYSRVALTTGLYMMGLGVGSVIFSPTAILFGKRPVYLFSSLMFIATSIWCAYSPSFASLAAARVLQGISVSPVECLPSATIAEIFFLHERAYRIGIYGLLLLGGKNLVPLVSAVIIQAKGWRWVFYILAIAAAFGSIMLFFCVPETFWDRTPRPKSRRPTMRHRSVSSIVRGQRQPSIVNNGEDQEPNEAELEKVMTPRQLHLHEVNAHARFDESKSEEDQNFEEVPVEGTADHRLKFKPSGIKLPKPVAWPGLSSQGPDTDTGVPHLHNLNSPYYVELEKHDEYLRHHDNAPASSRNETPQGPSSAAKDQLSRNVSTRSTVASPIRQSNVSNLDGSMTVHADEKDEAGTLASSPHIARYTTALIHAPPKTYVQSLKPWNGRLSRVSWFKVMVRPFILYAYPSVLWSALVYSLSVGWLIVLSESVSDVYRNRDSYNFSALSTGLVYLSPFIGGVLGTAVAGKVSDIIVRFMSRRNGGVYEPEFRLVMALPIAITTIIGLMGFGWSAEERDRWIVPTFFFGVISFGCSLGSTTAITFCVDSYRQYAGEALVTLNFSKNIFHGLVWSLFFPHWLQSDGPKDVFLAIGGIQLACMLTTIPMYIYGKRARMWTTRKNLMEKF